MIVKRWFNTGAGVWESREREIPATFKEQRRFFSGALPPEIALPQASEEDIQFLMNGICCHPSELP